MTKQKAIRKFCLTCCETSKDVALCTDVGCFLWPYRLGCDLKSKDAIQMMARINEAYKEEIADMGENYGLDPALFSPRPPVARSNRAKLNEVASDVN